MSSVVVVGEVDGNEVKEVSQQVAAVAAGMGEVIGVIMGKDVTEAAMKLATSKIVIADNEALENYDPVKYASVVAQVVENNQASKVLMRSTTMRKDLAPRLAAEIKWGYLGD